MLVSWVVFPLLLTLLCLGCGLLLEACLGRRLPGPMLAPAGLVVLVVLVGVFTSRGETARFASVAVIVAALFGLALAFPPGEGAQRLAPWSGRRPDGWVIAAALGAFAVFAAPVVLSGEPTFTGYIKLDDTATWLAFVDRVMDHGRDLSGLEPSTYQRTLEVNLPAGYPVGAFLPLGVGSQLTGTDPAWLVQPYMATMAGLLTLCLCWLARPLVESPRLRALVAFGAAQSALLFAYSLWGGIKEVAVALAIAVLAALAPLAAARELGWRGVIPAAVATTALLTMVGSGGLVWVAPLLALVAVALWRAAGLRTLALRAAPLVAFVVVLGVPALFAAGVFSPTQGGLTSAAELGNLFGPLKLVQYVGIWPTGDFRLDPINGPLAGFLIGLAILAALIGVVLAGAAAPGSRCSTLPRPPPAASPSSPTPRPGSAARRSPRAAPPSCCWRWPAPPPSPSGSSGCWEGRYSAYCSSACCGPTPSATTTSASPPTTSCANWRASAKSSPARGRR